MFFQGILILSEGLTGRSVYHIVNASEEFVISRVGAQIRLRLDRPKTRSRNTVNVEGIRVDDDTAAFHLARNP